ncbi:MAG: CoA-binding protein [Chloroflexota bacterium]|nr:CoA-binding protein [Chloroflexota bacterium]
MNEQRLKEFEYVLSPGSIAVVGASRDETKFGTGYLRGLLTTGFKGDVYAVHPDGGKILGVDAYPSLTDIPGPVDYVIVSIPAKYIIPLLDDCAIKGVKAVQMFTAGFKESGTEEGRSLEMEITKRAKEGGFHIVGPNCIGVYNPRINMPYGMAGVIGEVGSVSVISQSGGVGGKVVKAGMLRGIHFNKVVSFGNGCDLDSVDYFEYFAQDPQTEIIGAYLEGVADGPRLFHLLRETAAIKPVVIWKGGRTPAGAATANSHTGSLAASDTVWTAMARQAGVVKVGDADELSDALLALQYIRKAPGNRLSIVAGIMGGGGGDSVSSTDTCSLLGLQVLPFSDETRKHLVTLLPTAGSILRNPLDMGSVGANLGIMEKTLEIVATDPCVDLIIIQDPIDDLISFLGRDLVRAINDIFVRFSGNHSKPLIVVSPMGAPSPDQREIEGMLSYAHIPVFPTLERAAKAIINVNQYYQHHT